MRRCFVIGFLVGAVACKREASAQVYAQNPLAPVECFRIVDARQLSSDSAIQLCSSALSDAPGQCYVQSLDEFHELTTDQILQLCGGATTTQPVACYARLSASGVLTENQMIDYCRTTCALGPPPPEASNPACLDAALTDTDLSLQLAGELCNRSSSAGPVACFVAGQDLHKIADSKLITLCAEYRNCQSYYGTYYGAPTSGYYGAPTGYAAPAARY
jgi:hypothetical protein